MPFFSVVIPLYNKASFVDQTLRSVLSQTFSDFEVIVVNDCSTDESPEIVRKFDDPRIRMITHDNNRGLSAARNTGIKNAEADHVALLDADDLWNADFLEKIHQMTIRFPEASIFASGYEELYPDGRSVIPHKNLNFKVGETNIVADFYLANSAQPIYCFSGVVFKKEVFEEAGYFDESISLGEDVDFNVRAHLHARLAYCNESLVRYNIFSENQITNSAIAGKKATDFDLYEYAASSRPSLKKYLDVNRYILAMNYRIAELPEYAEDVLLNIDHANLTRRQQIMLKLPVWIVRAIRNVKSKLLRKGIRITTFR